MGWCKKVIGRLGEGEGTEQPLLQGSSRDWRDDDAQGGYPLKG